MTKDDWDLLPYNPTYPKSYQAKIIAHLKDPLSGKVATLECTNFLDDEFEGCGTFWWETGSGANGINRARHWQWANGVAVGETFDDESDDAPYYLVKLQNPKNGKFYYWEYDFPPEATEEPEEGTRTIVITSPVLIGISNNSDGSQSIMANCDAIKITESPRFAALKWWRTLDDTERERIAERAGYDERQLSTLTGREIEKIYNTNH